MADVGCRVLWCPGYTDKFVTLGHGQDLKLYKVVQAQQDSLQRPVANIRSHDLGIYDDRNAVLLSRISHISFRCVALYPKADLDSKVVIALGQLNGTVTVRTFDQTKIGPLDNEREFVPRHERPCNTLAWNPVNSNWLAAGLERARNDVSFFVWDITSKTNVGLSSGSLERTRSTLNSSARIGHSSKDYVPDSRLIEAGSTFETTSIAWFSTEPNSLIAGQGGKFLKIFDIRDQLDNSKPKQYTNTKAVHGVCIDPNFENRVASFVEGHQGVVLIWDKRQFEKPLLVIPQGEQVTQIEWNPTRSGLLASLRKDSNVVQLYDIQYGSPAYGNVSNEAEPTALERHTRAVDFTISGFSWHPTDANRMLTTSPKENVRDLTIFEPICLSWSPGFSLTWGCGRHLIQCSEESGTDEDISLKMHKRACSSYGIDWNNTKNIDDPKLARLWAWFSRITLVQKKLDGKFKTVKFPGVKSVICGEAGAQGVCPNSNEFKDARMLATMYYSDERYIALQLCNWNFDGDNGSNLSSFLQELAAKGKFEKAAAIAVFNNDIPSAINLLTDGAKERLKDNLQQDPFLGMVAMALSGYTEEKKSLWRERSLSLCTQAFDTVDHRILNGKLSDTRRVGCGVPQGSNLGPMKTPMKSKLSDPYLRAVFTFLSCDADFTDVLKECGLEIEDQVAFACRYLPDGQLGNYLSDLCKDMIKSGNLEGILVTGMTEDGINLLQNYINKTGDIQTVCVLAINSLPSKLIGESIKVNNWIQSYRDLLDRWRLWHQRAEFDIYHHSKGVSVDSKQVFVSCTFCGSSISAQNSMSLTAGRLRYLSPKEIPTNKMKSISCPGCRKPLPRCSQCLMHMGTTSTSFSTKTKASNVFGVQDPVEHRKVNPALKWFTWCQTCRHGGHASHMTEWFREHSECPVNNCDCNCMNLDPVKQETSKI